MKNKIIAMSLNVRLDCMPDYIAPDRPPIRKRPGTWSLQVQIPAPTGSETNLRPSKQKRGFAMEGTVIG